MTHKCIKPNCPNTYEDDDVDPYYCPSCREENQKIALAISNKLSKTRSKKTVNLLTEYNSLPRGPHGYPIYR